jgi:hypothetical protein
MTISSAPFIVLMLTLTCACSTPPKPSPALAEGSFTAQQLACVDQATTLEESRACRARVRAAWAVDGGAR